MKIMETMTKNTDCINEYINKLERLGYVEINYDAIWKWASLLYMFDGVKDKLSGNKVVDAGGGLSPVCAIISELGFKYDNVERKFGANWFPKDIGLDVVETDNLKLIEMDFLDYTKNVESNSVDVVIDGCSIIHFDPNKEYKQSGLYATYNEISRILKDDGFLIVVSDILHPYSEVEDDTGEFMNPKELIKRIKSSGLSPSKKLKIETSKNIGALEKKGSGHYGIKNKNIDGYILQRGIPLSVLRGIFYGK